MVEEQIKNNQKTRKAQMSLGMILYRLLRNRQNKKNTQDGLKNRTCLSVDISTTVTCRKARDVSKVLECCKKKGPTLHSKLFKYFLPNFHKSSLHLPALRCAQVS